MFDNSKELNKEDKEILEFIKNKNSIILLNKIDLKENNLENCKEILNAGKKIIKISLLSESNLSDLYKELDIMFGLEKIMPDNEITITNIRASFTSMVNAIIVAPITKKGALTTRRISIATAT